MPLVVPERHEQRKVKSPSLPSPMRGRPQERLHTCRPFEPSPHRGRFRGSRQRQDCEQIARRLYDDLFSLRRCFLSLLSLTLHTIFACSQLAEM